MIGLGSNPFAIAGAGLVIEPGPGLTVGELRIRAAYLARAAIGETRRVARAFLFALARRAAAELARLARWRVADVEAVEAMVAPMATGRGPPAPRDVAVIPSRVRDEIESLTNRQGAPSMTLKNEEAPRKGLPVNLSKIPAPHALRIMIANGRAIVRVACYVMSCAAGLNKVVCRALAIG